jgi:hypothetical protein
MADVILNITVPDAWVTKVLNAFNTITDTHMTVSSRGSNPNPALDFDGHWDFRITDKVVSEDNKEFGERVSREILKAVVNMVDKAEDSVRYKTEVAAIVAPASDVDPDILT